MSERTVLWVVGLVIVVGFAWYAWRRATPARMPMLTAAAGDTPPLAPTPQRALEQTEQRVGSADTARALELVR